MWQRLLVASVLVGGLATVAIGGREDAHADVCSRVHVFYCNWYGTPETDGRWVHWQQGGHQPPAALGANYYPKLGPYSSNDPQVLAQHMQWIRQSGAGVLSVTWWGQGSYEDQQIPMLLDAADKAGLKVNFHLEPYTGQTPSSTVADIGYILGRYGEHPAFYRARAYDGRAMFYVFEALNHPADQWRRAFEQMRADGINPLMIGQTTNVEFIIDAGFDGGYPYDVLAIRKQPGLFGRWLNEVLPRFEAAGKLFIVSVGPGYWDDRAVPAGADEPAVARTRDAGTGSFYAASWQRVSASTVPFVTVVSFNEWHEGSQIEPAVQHSEQGVTYPGYASGNEQYLHMTRRGVQAFCKSAEK